MTAALAPIATSTEQVHAARQAHAEAQAQLARRVMPELDAVIRGCEDRNLIDHKRSGKALAKQANDALDLADAFLASHEKSSPTREAITHRVVITRIQDDVFAMQEAVLDALHPERIRLAKIDAGSWHRESEEVA
jgi:hypothetical protein